MIKQLSNYIYDAKEKSWEIPVTSLAQYVDMVCEYDDIQINLIKNKKEQKSKEITLNKHKTKLFDYQEDGIKFGLQHDNFLLLDAPGLGKSLQTIYIAEELKQREKIEHCLIICGINTLKHNWKKEIEKHSTLDCKILGERTTKTGKTKIGSVADRISDLKNPIEEFFVISNIETFRNADIIKAIQKGKNKFDLIVIDECHCCKSASAQQSKNVLKLKAKHKIGLTGTLLTNSPLDAYMPLKWIGAENSSFTNYKFYYCNYGGNFNNILLGYKNLDVLKDTLDRYSLRRTKDTLNLPSKTIIHEVLDMDDNQQRFYDNVKNGIKDEVDKVELKTATILGMIIRLRQASSCPSILTSENISSAKIDRAEDLINQIVDSGSKVVVFSDFKEPLNVLNERIKQHNPLICTGDIKDSIISKNIDDFQTKKDNKVLLATISKMGTGITLTAATYAIFIGSAWTQAQNLQCEDRIYRIGSEKPVFIYYLWNKDTIDEHVKEIVETKGLVSDFIIDDSCPPQLTDKLKSILQDL